MRETSSNHPNRPTQPSTGDVFFVHESELPQSTNDCERNVQVYTIRDFEDKDIQMNFIRKVYSLLIIISITWLSIALLFYLTDEKIIWIPKYRSIIYIVIVISIVSLFVLTCCRPCRRKFPINLICLSIFTVFQCFTFGFITVYYKTPIFLYTISIIMTICIAIVLVTFQTNFDFTCLNGIALVTGVVLSILGMTFMFVNNILPFTVGAIGSLLFGFYLVYDTRSIISGSHHSKILPNEYIFGTITLFTGIIDIILCVFTERWNNRFTYF